MIAMGAVAFAGLVAVVCLVAVARMMDTVEDLDAITRDAVASERDALARLDAARQRERDLLEIVNGALDANGLIDLAAALNNAYFQGQADQEALDMRLMSEPSPN